MIDSALHQNAVLRAPQPGAQIVFAHVVWRQISPDNGRLRGMVPFRTPDIAQSNAP